MRGLLARRRRPRAALPIERVRRRRVVVPFPPRRAIGTKRGVRENRIALNHVGRGGVRLPAGARQHAEKSGFRIHCPETAVFTGPNPRDVVANCKGLPAGHRRGRHEHRHVRFAACGRKRARDVPHGAVLVLAAHDQHVLGEPAFIARLPTGNPQREALLAEQGIAAVAGAD